MKKLKWRRVFFSALLTAAAFGAFSTAAILPVRGADANAPSGLLVDLIEKSDVVWLDGFPSQLTLAEAETAVERTQIAEIRSSRPAFSWIVSASVQTAWRVQVATDLKLLTDAETAENGPNVWDSGKVDGAESTAVAFGASEPLKGATVYYWRVKIWDGDGNPSAWSAPKAFKTAAELAEYGSSRYPLTKRVDRPVSEKKIDDRTTFFDFGRASFAQIKLEIETAGPGRVALVRVGERVKDGRVDRKPAGTTRYWEYRLPLDAGRRDYSIKTRVDRRNSTGAAVLMPDYIGEVLPFRYAEVEILPLDESAQNAEKRGAASAFAPKFEPKINAVWRDSVTYPFDETASYFRCDDDRLNAVWDLCKYSIKATTFAGIYLDGDRERIPYEGDALLNQLSHYSVDREFSLARYSQEYMIFHPTWPTEWILQSVQMAWYDYLYTGDSRNIRRYYEELKAKSLVSLAEENGLISTRKGKLTPEVVASVHFKNGQIRDIVDWPHKGLAGNENADSGETDGFVFCDFNVVVNAYHFFALNSMKKFAEILGETADAAFFEAQIAKARVSFQEVFFDKERGVYHDGDATDHASLHGNMFPLAFGLVPAENVECVTKFVESRGMRCSVYGAQFLLDAAFEGENGRYGFERMVADDLRGWLNMIRVGSTISLEAWDDRYKPNQDWNHAWGAAPANVIPRKLVGVEPTSPGFATLRVKPQIADLKEVAAIVPTIRGSVELAITQTETTYSLNLTLPGNVKADVYLPATSDADELRVDGEPASKTFAEIERVGAFWKISNVGAGTRKFERVRK